MALVTESKKSCAVNPLKMSQPLVLTSRAATRSPPSGQWWGHAPVGPEVMSSNWFSRSEPPPACHGAIHPRARPSRYRRIASSDPRPLWRSWLMS